MKALIKIRDVLLRVWLLSVLFFCPFLYGGTETTEDLQCCCEPGVTEGLCCSPIEKGPSFTTPNISSEEHALQTINLPDFAESSLGIPVILGVPINFEGTSSNLISEFNVSEKGLIVANSCESLCTPETGCVPGNPYVCKHGPAMTIEFKVTGAAPSFLAGPIYVVGKAADFQLLNPSGITCDGSQFINTPRVTLSTKDFKKTNPQEPFYSDIIVQGKGIHGEQLVRLVGRRVEISGPITAKEVVHLEGNLQRSQSQDRHPLAIDVAPMANIKTGSIYLIATNEGVGVRTKGSLQTTKADLTVKTPGPVEVTGPTESVGNIHITGTHITASNLQASNLYLHTHGYNLNANGIKDSITLNDLELDGKPHLEYSHFPTTAKNIFFYGKQFVNTSTLHLDNLRIHTKEFSFNQGSIHISNTGTLEIIGAGFVNQKLWRRENGVDHTQPNTGIIETGSLKFTSSTAGGFLNKDGAILKTTNPKGNFHLETEGHFVSFPYKRMNGAGPAGDGFEFIPSTIDIGGDLTLNVGGVRIEGSTVTQGPGGDFFKIQALEDIVSQAAQGAFFSHNVPGECLRKAYRTDDGSFIIGHHPCVLWAGIPRYDNVVTQQSILNINNKADILSETGDITLAGVFSFFRDGVIFQTPEGTFRHDAIFGEAEGTIKLNTIGSEILGEGINAFIEQVMGGNTATGEGGEAVPRPIGMMFVAGPMKITTKQDIHNSAAILGISDKADIILDPGLGKVYNTVKGQWYETKHIHTKNYEALVHGLSMSPAVIAALGDSTITLAGDYQADGGDLIARHAKFEGDVTVNAVSFKTQNYEREIKRRLFSKQEHIEESDTVVLKPASITVSQAEFAANSTITVQGGVLHIEEAKGLEHVRLCITHAMEEVRTHITDKTTQFQLLGIFQVMIDAIDGKDFKTAAENVPFVYDFINFVHMKSPTDLEPGVRLGTDIWGLLEEFTHSYQANGGKAGGAFYDTLQDFLGVENDLPKGMWRPKGFGVKHRKDEYTQVRYQVQPGVAHFGKVDGSFKSIDMSGDARLKIDEKLEATVEEDVTMEAEKVVETEEKETTINGVTVTIGKGFKSGSVSYSHAETGSKKRKERVLTPSIEGGDKILHIKGELKSEGLIKGGTLKMEVEGKAVFTSVSSYSELQTKKKSWSAGLSVSTLGFLPNIGFGGGSGEGHGSWTENIAGIDVEYVDLTFHQGVCLNGAMIDANGGVMRTDSLLFINIFDEYRYSSSGYSVSLNIDGILTLLGDKGQPTALPMPNTKAGKSIPGMMGWEDYESEKSRIVHSMVGRNIDVQKLDGTPGEVPEGIVRDKKDIFENLSDREKVRSVGIPIINGEALANTLGAMSDTLTDMRDKLIQHLDTIKAAIPEQYPEAKQQIESIQGDLVVSANIVDAMPIPEEEKKEVFADLTNLVVDPNKIELGIRQGVEKRVLGERSLKEGRLEELLVISDAIQTQKAIFKVENIEELEAMGSSKWNPLEHFDKWDIMEHPAQALNQPLKDYDVFIHHSDKAETLKTVEERIPVESKDEMRFELAQSLETGKEDVAKKEVGFWGKAYKKFEVVAGKLVDGIHIGLDFTGMAPPPFGVAADLTNAVLHTIEGNPVAATASAFSAIPGGTEAALGAKVATKGWDLAKGGWNLAKEGYTLAKREIAGLIEDTKSAFTLRNTPGKATGGEGLKVIADGDTWLRGTHGNAGKVPGQVAEKMRGMEFKNFDEFRQTFWKTVADDPVLCRGFDPEDIKLMKTKGTAPLVADEQTLGRINSYQLHHAKPIHDNGPVYDFDNIYVLTPKFHKEILEEGYHYGRRKN